MKLDFYRAFEEKYRGPREGIKLRLQVYRQFIEPIKTLYSDLKAVDLGCGRGEWLEVLGEAGFYPNGVDVDDGMLADCKTLGLSYVKEDAIKHLKSLPDESQVIVSGIHIAEHLPFNALQALVIEALRVLKPCGLLILETPNPENIVVGATNFYLDPTHERPIPPELLIFLTDYYGFARSKILRLNEAPTLSNSNQVQLYDVITGASPDYAVIAQKNGNDADLKAFDAPFGLEFGLTLVTLAQRHDTKIEHKLNSISQRIDYAEKMLSENSDRIEVLHQKNTELQVALEARHQQIQAIYQSYSWRITAPLRWTASALHGLSPGAMKAHATTLLRHAARYVIARSRLRNAALALLDRLPSVKSRLSRIPIGDALPQVAAAHVPIDLAHLTPHARRIYADLKAAIEHRRKVNR